LYNILAQNNSGSSAGSDYRDEPVGLNNLPPDPLDAGDDYHDVADSVSAKGASSNSSDINDNDPVVTDGPGGDEEEATMTTTKKPRKKTTKKPIKKKKKKKRPVYIQPPTRPEVVPVPVPQLPKLHFPRITGNGMPAGKNNELNKKDCIPCDRSRCCSRAYHLDFCTCHYCRRDQACCYPQRWRSE
jgi:hypothetical protein